MDFPGWAENPCLSLQPLEDSLIAFRTRSKRPLKDVPLGQLEAELRAPDITPDMYDPNTADDEEWKRWLGGLMNDDVENEGTWQLGRWGGHWDWGFCGLTRLGAAAAPGRSIQAGDERMEQPWEKDLGGWT